MELMPANTPVFVPRSVVGSIWAFSSVSQLFLGIVCVGGPFLGPRVGLFRRSLRRSVLRRRGILRGVRNWFLAGLGLGHTGFLGPIHGLGELSYSVCCCGQQVP